MKVCSYICTVCLTWVHYHIGGMLKKLNALMLLLREHSIATDTRGYVAQTWVCCIKCKFEDSNGVIVGMARCKFNIFGSHFLSTLYTIHTNNW